MGYGLNIPLHYKSCLMLTKNLTATKAAFVLNTNSKEFQHIEYMYLHIEDTGNTTNFEDKR